MVEQLFCSLSISTWKDVKLISQNIRNLASRNFPIEIQDWRISENAKKMPKYFFILFSILSKKLQKVSDVDIDVDDADADDADADDADADVNVDVVRRSNQRNFQRLDFNFPSFLLSSGAGFINYLHL